MMTTEQTHQFIEDYFTAIRREKSEATLNKYIADPELKTHIELTEKGLPNYQLTAIDIIAEGEKVAVRAMAEGVHQGDLFGVPPTGRNVSFEFLIVYEIKNQKIVDHWLQFDTMNLMQQVGVKPMANME